MNGEVDIHHRGPFECDSKERSKFLCKIENSKMENVNDHSHLFTRI